MWRFFFKSVLVFHTVLNVSLETSCKQWWLFLSSENFWKQDSCKQGKWYKQENNMNVDIFFKCSVLHKNLYWIKGKNTKQVWPVGFTVVCNKTSKRTIKNQKVIVFYFVLVFFCFSTAELSMNIHSRESLFLLIQCKYGEGFYIYKLMTSIPGLTSLLYFFPFFSQYSPGMFSYTLVSFPED